MNLDVPSSQRYWELVALAVITVIIPAFFVGFTIHYSWKMGEPVSLLFASPLVLSFIAGVLTEKAERAKEEEQKEE